MEIIVRKPNLHRMTSDGIPLDFAQVMRYFNQALKDNKYPFVARRKPITVAEVRELWLPSARKNIILTAQAQGKVVGQLTVLYTPNANAYEHRNERVPGDIAETADPNFDEIAIKRSLVESVVTELKRRGLQARFLSPAEDPFLEVLESMKYQATESEGVERYKAIGLSGKARAYLLP
jgi:hypothetical protein